MNKAGIRVHFKLQSTVRECLKFKDKTIKSISELFRENFPLHVANLKIAKQKILLNVLNFYRPTLKKCLFNISLIMRRK